ncbi:MAG: serine/threonine protein kinase, partial [Planctomycetales bacterium]|nr:serine/threonine protein kinase [Planctomycetales bacterium]
MAEGEETDEFVFDTPQSVAKATLPANSERYEFESLIGVGGYANVYLALDRRLHRKVAVKVLRRERAKSSREIDQFLNEARTVADLDHSGIVPVYDVAKLENGLPYVVMQYIAGQSLEQSFATRRYSLRESVELVSKLAMALQYAHQRGCFHRDIKPGNILLDRNGEPRISDFGLAVRYADQGAKAGEIAGTPRYMSPEQVKGEAHRLDGRTDIWALGAILYRLLTGEMPFRGSSRELADEVLHRHPRPPRQLNGAIPKDLEKICLRCLQKSPSDRYTSAVDLNGDLQAWLKTHDGESLPDLVTGKTGFDIAPRKHRTIVLAMVGTIIVGGGAYQLFSALGASSDAPTESDISTQVITSDTSVPIDERAVPLRWLPLFDTKPEELVWSPWETAQWHFDEVRQTCQIDNPSTAMLKLGETRAKEYRIQVDISKSSWTGSSGVFFGLSVDTDNTGKRNGACSAL